MKRKKLRLYKPSFYPKIDFFQVLLLNYATFRFHRVCIKSISSTRPKKILRFSCIRVDLLLYERKTSDKRGQYDWRGKNIWTGSEFCVSGRCFFAHLHFSPKKTKQLLSQVQFANAIVIVSSPSKFL